MPVGEWQDIVIYYNNKTENKEMAMRMLTDEEVISTRETVGNVLARNGIEQWGATSFLLLLVDLRKN